ncbi:hypothetical protein EGW08_009983 [Elysia chlorotica]|uniref:Smr domain-containing protein n=1 Tax=Elysia chlorotica TaxID=188477 RepID=A0A3S1B8B5_ELYCH|nr:hypothetical protein EGW08_009983 [Elysia chlorotica]
MRPEELHSELSSHSIEKKTVFFDLRSLMELCFMMTIVCLSAAVLLLMRLCRKKKDTDPPLLEEKVRENSYGISAPVAGNAPSSQRGVFHSVDEDTLRRRTFSSDVLKQPMQTGSTVINRIVPSSDVLEQPMQTGSTVINRIVPSSDVLEQPMQTGSTVINRIVPSSDVLEQPMQTGSTVINRIVPTIPSGTFVQNKSSSGVSLGVCYANSASGHINRIAHLNPIHRSVQISSIHRSVQISSSTQENPATKNETLRIEHKNSDVGPITRIAPILSPTQNLVQRITPAPITGSNLQRRTSAHSSIHQAKSEKPTQEPRSGTKNNRAAPTPIVVAHPPRSHSYVWRHDDFGSEHSHLGGEEETEEDEDEDEDEEKEEEEEDEEDKIEDESVQVEEDESALLDLRGLFVREALAAVQAFLPEQDQKYIDSGFNESHRFVYIVTGWGKLSPGKVPKLKPAVEDLLNSGSYKITYDYQWTNDGEMQVDLIGRKTEAELREKTLKRMQQRKHMQRRKFST